MGLVLVAEGYSAAPFPLLSSDPSNWSRKVDTEYSLLGAVQTGPPLTFLLSILGPPGLWELPLYWRTKRSCQNPLASGNGKGEGRKGNCLSELSFFPPSITLRGQGPKVSGNGAALFEMFSYLIPCPGKGPSLTLRVAPNFPCFPYCPDGTPQVLICCLLPSFTPVCFSSSLALPP